MSRAGPKTRPRPWRHTLALPLIWALKAYQYLISPLTPPTCRFYPSCSAYAVTALERHGPGRGTWLAVRRLLRCHPWNPGGVDHVPQRCEVGATGSTTTPGPHPPDRDRP